MSGKGFSRLTLWFAVAASAALSAGAQAAEATCTVKPFAGGVFNSAAEESRIAFSKDGNTAYFGRSSEFGPAAKNTMYVSQRVEGKWGEPAVASFSGTFSDFDPFLSPDGKRLYFSSNRPIEGTEPKDVDIWFVEMAGDAWGVPAQVANVNKPGDDLFPSLTPSGSLVFASDRGAPGKNFDIYEATGAKGAFAAAKPMNERINTKAWEFNPIVVPVARPDGAAQDMLLFVALNRKGGRGLGDLFVTPYGGKLPLAPEPIRSAINSPADEYHPTLMPNGKTLVFVRRAVGKASNGDFMEASWPACAFAS